VWSRHSSDGASLGPGTGSPTTPPSVDAIGRGITERTRAIVVNSPNNPTGRIYPPDVLRKLADVLSEASERIGRPIYLVSDESYNRILFDGNQFDSPTSFYPRSFLVYTYGKSLLTPGQRIGYLALSPSMPERELVRGAVFMMLLAAGYAFPSVVLQRALADLDSGPRPGLTFISNSHPGPYNWVSEGE
jgi:aspartate aminotransferase